ncbi:OmpH family outer membrane protein [Selenomonadales bacterium OttesenSCG-928-I06]|nr:OmpH family outer membrane protein [Selenomonadales bacterium OttesenSCG-928-I06]
MFKSKNKAQIRVLAILVIVLTAFFLTGCMGSKASIGVVDTSKIMKESPKVQQFQEQLQEKAKELSANLEKEQAGLNEEQIQAKQEAAYGELLKMQQDFGMQFNETVKSAIEQVSKEKKIDVILFKEVVAHGGVDVTEDVLKKLQ